MKKINYLSLLIILCLSFSQHKSFAQTPTSYGKEFRVSFMPNYVGPGSSLMLDFSARNLATVTVSTMHKDSTILVLPGLVTTVVLPESVIDESAFSVSKNTVHIVSDEDITVFATNSRDRSTDATLVLPLHLLGTDYILQTYNESENIYYSYGAIIATEDATEVEIVPGENMESFIAGEPFTVILDKGKSYILRSYNPQGTTIKSTDPCKPIAVFSASQCTNVQGPYCDHLFEQMWPLKYWGKTFLTVPLLSRSGGDGYRITASEDHTQIRINRSSTPGGLNALEFADLIIEDPSIIESDKPISVLQLSNGGSYDNNVRSDPFMVSVLPVEQAIDFITFSTTNGMSADSVDHYVNVTSKTADIKSVLLDSNLLYNDFKPYPKAPEYSYAQVPVKNIVPFLTTHALASTGGMNAIVYGYAYHYSYGYTSGGAANNTSFSFTYDEVPCTEKAIHFTADISKVLFANKVSWDFGDGASSNVLNPTHTYAQPGTYQVKLKVANTSGCFTDSVTRTLQVNIRETTSPEATVSADQSICRGESVQLSASGGTKYSWFPAEGLSNPNISNPVASPLKTTRYVVTVSVDSTCSFDTASVSVSIKPLPVAKAKYETDGLTVQFHSYANDDINFWIWDFGDGSAWSYEMEPYHAYKAKGTYTVNLTVKRACGDENNVSFALTIDGGKTTDSVQSVGFENPNLINENLVSLLPNPVSDYFQIETEREIKQISLLDINGRVLKTCEGKQEKISMQDIQPGLYFVQVEFNGQAPPVTLKLIKGKE